ncbi:hypothetical protein CJI59_13955 [Streptomyces sp. Alain-F2R5]|nr:hypothetical protein [Streptomyces sp. Alain-F2R5]PAN01022.1 hypothetical protein CJI59_13955 [Streptomyces sp. Alain-F2R5]
MSAAQVLAAAVAELRSVPPGDPVAVDGGVIPARVAEPLAAWLETAHDYVTRSHPDLALASPFRRGAVDLAHALLRARHHPRGVYAAAEAGIPATCAVCGPMRWPCPTVNVSYEETL